MRNVLIMFLLLTSVSCQANEPNISELFDMRENKVSVLCEKFYMKTPGYIEQEYVRCPILGGWVVERAMFGDGMLFVSDIKHVWKIKR